MRLKIRLHHQEANTAKYTQVWYDDLEGKNADQAYHSLLALQQDPYMHGEMVSLRFKEGKGGGCQISGSFLEADFIDFDEIIKEVDAYFGGGKWRSW